MKVKLNLTAFFKKEGKTLISSYKRLMERRLGIAMDRAPSNKPATVRKKGKDHWLVDTGETKNKGFKSKAEPLRLVVYASESRHSGRSTQMKVDPFSKRKAGRSRIPTVKTIRKAKNPLTYRQIFELHNTAKGRYSGIFQKAPTGSKIFQRLDKEIAKQVQKQIGDTMRKKFRRIR